MCFTDTYLHPWTTLYMLMITHKGHYSLSTIQEAEYRNIVQKLVYL